MFDYRYHALSLVAVFVALAIGLLLGIAVGDRELVSSARDELEADLKGDLLRARAEAVDLRRELTRRTRYEEQTYRPLVAERLDGRRVVLLFVGERSESVFAHVRDAIRPSGGELSFVSTLQAPLDLAAIGAAAAGTRYEGLADDPSLLDDLGRRLAVQLLQGGRLLRAVEGEIFSSSAGDLAPAEAVVLFRSPGEEKADGKAADQRSALLAGMLEGFERFGTPVVGVEEGRTDPSQVPWYTENGLPSVDNVDDVAGRASLVFAAAGSAEGAYGEKSTADSLVPEALVGRP